MAPFSIGGDGYLKGVDRMRAEVRMAKIEAVLELKQWGNNQWRWIGSMI
jgi:hypothetical protein